MLYITASTGVFSYDPKSENFSHVITNKNRDGFFSKKSHGFFGICLDKNTNQIIVASRENLGTKYAGKPTTDAGLHYIDPVTNTYSMLGYVKDVHDVHQIDIYNNTVFLTDTGKNRIIAYDIINNKISCIINFGHIRKDIHHINAVTIVEDKILVGMNNGGDKSSEILEFPLTIIDNHNKIDDAFEHATTTISLAPYKNTHDIEPYNNSFLICSSHDSIVIDSQTVKPVIHSENWVRGISQDDAYIWVGQSHYAKRSKRHSKHLDGSILKINSESMKTDSTITVPGTGQINDLLWVK